MHYKVEYDRDEKNDDIFEVVDADGDILITLREPADADALVDHLNNPRPGEYIVITDNDNPNDVCYVLLDTEGDSLIVSEHYQVLDDLLTHLHRNR